MPPGIREQFIRAPGVNFESIALSSGQINSVQIDNPSGSWLQLFPTRDWVPPYTLGFTRTFLGAVQSVRIVAGDGPSGQVGTTDGDDVVVILTNVPMGNAQGSPNGAPFIDRFTPVLTNWQFLFATTSGQLGNLLPAQVGKRYRLWTVNVGRTPQTVGLDVSEDSPFVVYLQTPAFTRFHMSQLGPANEHVAAEFSEGLDFPLGEGVDSHAFSEWMTCGFNLVVTYSVI